MAGTNTVTTMITNMIITTPMITTTPTPTPTPMTMTMTMTMPMSPGMVTLTHMGMLTS
jgi:hypothetical protein